MRSDQYAMLYIQRLSMRKVISKREEGIVGNNMWGNQIPQVPVSEKIYTPNLSSGTDHSFCFKNECHHYSSKAAEVGNDHNC